MRLTAKLFMILFLAVVAVTWVVTFLSVRSQLESFQEGREQIARELRAKVSDQLEEAWEEGGRAEVEEALSNVHVELRRTQLRWVQFNAPTDHPDSPSAPLGLLKEVIEGQVDSVVLRDKSGKEWLHTYLPIDDVDSPVGIELKDSLDPFNEKNRAAIRSTLKTLVGISAVFLAALLYSGIQLVGRPLQQLIAKTKEIGQGDLSRKITIAGSDELSQLAEALNEVSEQLRQDKETIEAETAARIATESQLRHADRLKTVGRLAAGIAHELGTPLNVVAGRAGLIATGKLSELEMRESASTIKSEADRVTGIIRQLMDFARHRTLRRSKTDLRTVLSRTTDLLGTLAERKGVTLKFESIPQPLFVNCDEGQIQQVVTNIIMNAIQSMDGEGSVTLSSGTRVMLPPGEKGGRESSFAFVQIQDDGNGIDPRDMEHLFEPFFTTKDVGEGTGLGLSIAYGIVQDHDGWIDVQSTLGQGSCFTIYLPQEIEL